MTPAEIATTVAGATVALLGVGGLTKMFIAWLDAKSDPTTQVIAFAEHGREDTGRLTHGWTECERRCGRLERENADLRATVKEQGVTIKDQGETIKDQDARIRVLERRDEERNLRERAREEEMRWMRGAIRGLRDSTPPKGKVLEWPKR